ncbi:5-oxoprolinase subunit PxpA [Maribacter algarum]|uniref:5-oxoprolinase subunit PxpA n=1 Tax=Maribacter algarum (ex Zhang et al. 2020) TaxID=2578118 RepID=A0A5S3PR28_9FLAO|nr:5-oxoprolinase subunit PxpA [Maribacter algarum]TMM57121.1 5-oxoprolinase subunit PxpA [Maribacter algarum]
MKKYSIDINCDVGEGIGNEAELLPLISSCNIACGGHAGDIETMTNVVRLAKENKVRVGAHPSYPDKQNFGRVSMDIPSELLVKSIQTQIESFTSVLEKENVPIHHIKPHGALYNDIVRDEDLAKVFLEAIAMYKGYVFLYVPYNSKIEAESLKKNFNIKYEAFGDRNYNKDLSLVSRKLPNAVIEKPELVLSHLLSMVKEGRLKTQDGGHVELQADTFCIHGDTPSALQILMYLTSALPEHNILIKRE